MDISMVFASQSARAFGVALECQDVLIDIQIRNKALVDKLAAFENEIKSLRAEAEMMKAQKIENAAKLDSPLAEIEALKKKVHESQCEVVSLIKKVEISNS